MIVSLDVNITFNVYLQENEKLKKELLEKSSRIDAQNNKISELLQRSQTSVDDDICKAYIQFYAQLLCCSIKCSIVQ